ncbi:MAG: hypothetical protein KME64_21795 [Scytonematopsis contorta HA4267-MV1]|nr:hypothetical protein [Scytonematopsis contorta HA4267-MV1]
MSSEIYQPTSEQLQRWAELDELDKYASAGIMSEEEQEQRVTAYLDKNYYPNLLEKVRQKKQKVQRFLAHLEQREQLLVAVIEREAQASSTTNSSH